MNYNNIHLEFMSESIVYQCILHPTDLSEDHFELCKKALEIANKFNAKLHLLHVIEQPASLQLAQGLGFAELLQPVKDDALTVMNLVGDALSLPAEQQHVEVGSVKQHILELVKSLNCDLLILGCHQRSLSPFLGSTGYTILHHAPCDVLTIRNTRASD